jgi:hypothetical protein
MTTSMCWSSMDCRIRQELECGGKFLLEEIYMLNWLMTRPADTLDASLAGL